MRTRCCAALAVTVHVCIRAGRPTRASGRGVGGGIRAGARHRTTTASWWCARGPVAALVAPPRADRQAAFGASWRSAGPALIPLRDGAERDRQRQTGSRTSARASARPAVPAVRRRLRCPATYSEVRRAASRCALAGLGFAAVLALRADPRSATGGLHRGGLASLILRSLVGVGYRRPDDAQRARAVACRWRRVAAGWRRAAAQRGRAHRAAIAPAGSGSRDASGSRLPATSSDPTGAASRRCSGGRRREAARCSYSTTATCCRCRFICPGCGSSATAGRPSRRLTSCRSPRPAAPGSAGGSACNLWPSRAQATYAIPGFRGVAPARLPVHGAAAARRAGARPGHRRARVPRAGDDPLPERRAPDPALASALSSAALRRRCAPGRRSPSWSGPNATRSSVRTRWPTASHFR